MGSQEFFLPARLLASPFQGMANGWKTRGHVSAQYAPPSGCSTQRAWLWQPSSRRRGGKSVQGKAMTAVLWCVVYMLTVVSESHGLGLATQRRWLEAIRLWRSWTNCC